MDWKHFANWLKVVLIIEAAFLFWLLPSRPVTDIAGIILVQYGLFFPVDLSIIIKNIKGVVDKP